MQLHSGLELLADISISGINELELLEARMKVEDDGRN